MELFAYIPLAVIAVIYFVFTFWVYPPNLERRVSAEDYEELRQPLGLMKTLSAISFGAVIILGYMYLHASTEAVYITIWLFAAGFLVATMPKHWQVLRAIESVASPDPIRTIDR